MASSEVLEHLSMARRMCRADIAKLQEKLTEFLKYINNMYELISVNYNKKVENNSMWLIAVEDYISTVSNVDDITRKFNLHLSLNDMVAKEAQLLAICQLFAKNQSGDRLLSAQMPQHGVKQVEAATSTDENQAHIWNIPHKDLSNFETNYEFEAMVAHVSRGELLKFFIVETQPHPKMIELLKLRNQIGELERYTKIPHDNEIFGLVLDNGFFRAVRGDEKRRRDFSDSPIYSALLLEFGEIVEIDEKSVMYRIPTELCEFPAQAIECVLGSINSQYQRADMQTVLNQYEFKKAKFTVIENTGKQLYVNLIQENEQKPPKLPNEKTIYPETLFPENCYEVDEWDRFSVEETNSNSALTNFKSKVNDATVVESNKNQQSPGETISKAKPMTTTYTDRSSNSLEIKGNSMNKTKSIEYTNHAWKGEKRKEAQGGKLDTDVVCPITPSNNNHIEKEIQKPLDLGASFTSPTKNKRKTNEYTKQGYEEEERHSEARPEFTLPVHKSNISELPGTLLCNNRSELPEKSRITTKTNPFEFDYNEDEMELPVKQMKDVDKSENQFKCNGLTESDMAMLMEEPLCTSNALKAVMGYVPTDESRLCKFYDPKTGGCFKGANCRLEHSPLIKDGWTKDVADVFVIPDKTLHYQEGDCITIIPTHFCSVEYFYAQVDDSNSTVNPIIWGPDEVPDNQILIRPPSVYDLVRCKYKDDHWYRAKVIEDLGDSFKVFYVDYGNYEVVPLKCLAKCSKTIMDQSYQAIKCRIADIRDNTKNPEERDDALKMLSLMVLNQKIFVQVMSHRDEMIISIVDERFIEVPNALITNGFAKACKTII